MYRASEYPSTDVLKAHQTIDLEQIAYWKILHLTKFNYVILYLSLFLKVHKSSLTTR